MLFRLGHVFHAEPCTLRLNMLFDLEHVFHAEPLHTSAKHALAEDVSDDAGVPANGFFVVRFA